MRSSLLPLFLPANCTALSLFLVTRDFVEGVWSIDLFAASYVTVPFVRAAFEESEYYHFGGLRTLDVYEKFEVIMGCVI